jgi:thiol-disulfide isomerase/thioredoxin
MRPLLLAVAALVVATVHGQSYAPETEYHDLSQRMFPVEAARVLAWLRAANGQPAIAEVTYEVSTTPTHETVWKIRWLDAAKKPVREKEVRYPESLLLSGAEFYRDVFAQLEGDDWAIAAASPDNAATTFWQGAELSGATRADGLKAAERLLNEKPKMDRPADAARIAGILSHAALPRFNQVLPVDSLLLARAAAWLRIAERKSREKYDLSWAPILFLSGREKLLVSAPWRPPGKQRAAERFWQTIASGRSSKDVLSFVAKPDNKAFAMPLLSYCASVDPLFAKSASEVADVIFDPATLDHLKEYRTKMPSAEPTAGPLLPTAWGSPEDMRDPHGIQGSAKPMPPEIAVKRLWLVPEATSQALAQLVEAHAADASLNGFIERLIRESGPMVFSRLVQPNAALTDAFHRLNQYDAIANALPHFEPLDRVNLNDAIASARSAPSSPTDAPPEKIDFTKFKTAEEFWAAVEKLREEPREHSDSPEDMMRKVRAWLTAKRDAANAFLKAYPNDAHRHQARLIAVDSEMQLAQFGDRSAKQPDRNELQAIAAAPDADATAKGEAEFFIVMLDAQSVDINSPHTVPPFQQALAAYLEKYPEHPRASYVASLLLQLLSQLDTPSTDPLLKKLAANPNEQISTPAKSVLQQRQFTSELKKKPLDLKFTAADGTEVDAAKLRGKVVLLDFWASWCGPCMGEAPHVAATYQKLHGKGLEIIGVSLDQDKAAMEAALKSAGMTWPQHYDGKGWQTDVAQRFGVQSIPSTWLFDKQGKLREHGLRGEELEARIENLLKEK